MDINNESKFSIIYTHEIPRPNVVYDIYNKTVAKVERWETRLVLFLKLITKWLLHTNKNIKVVSEHTLKLLVSIQNMVCYVTLLHSMQSRSGK